MAVPNAPFSPEIVSLRARIRSGKVDKIGFIGWKNEHYSGIFIVSPSGLENGDSLHLPSSPDLLHILRWVFQGFPGFEPPPTQTQIRAGLIDRQRTLLGGGSCGVAVMNFVETHIGLGIPRWQAAQSAQFRDVFLQELLLYHLIARQKKTVYSDWVIPCTSVGSSSDVP
ncbi:hypothetical protein B0H11DRAFT_2365617, partial [Mycena galericulata]